jgi:uncharacterized NAD(P)/FAD-binding protein YdhS
MPLPDYMSVYDGSLRFADRLDRGARIVIVGTGPGAIDCARYCVERDLSPFQIDLISSHGWLSRVQTKNLPDAAYEAPVENVVRRFERVGRVSLAEAAAAFLPVFTAADPTFDFVRLAMAVEDPLETLRLDVEQARRDRPQYRHVLEAIGTRMPRIWRCLSDADQELFDKTHKRLYYTFRHAMPIETGEWLIARLEAGALRIAREPVWTARETDMLAEAFFMPGGRQQVRYEHVVVATGPQWDLCESATPLQEHLLRSGLAKKHKRGGFETVNFELANSPNIFGMGGQVRGEDFAVHSLPALVRHAAAIEAIIAQRLQPRRRK